MDFHFIKAGNATYKGSIFGNTVHCQLRFINLFTQENESKASPSHPHNRKSDDVSQ